MNEKFDYVCNLYDIEYGHIFSLFGVGYVKLDDCCEKDFIRVLKIKSNEIEIMNKNLLVKPNKENV